MSWIFLMALAALVLVMALPMYAAATTGVHRNKFVDQDLRAFPMMAGAKIYKGTFAGLHPVNRLLKPLEGGDIFVGVAYEDMDNSAGDNSALTCRVVTQGDYVWPLTGGAPTGKAVYGVDDSTLSLVGHPDSFIGRVVGTHGADEIIVHLREWGEQPTDADFGSVDIALDLNRTFFANVLTATTEQGVAGGQLRADAIGAGIAGAGQGVAVAGNGDGVSLLLDNDSEAQNATIETPACLMVGYGMTFEARLRLSVAGGAATDDVDFGLMTAANGLITDAIRANMDATTAGIHTAKFHMDANANDVLVGTDNNVTVTGPVDSEHDNSLTEMADYHIIVRPSRAVEFWINGVRRVANTAFNIGSAATPFAGIVNIEKSTGTGVPRILVSKLRVAGGHANAA